MFLFIRAAIVPDTGVVPKGPRVGFLNELEAPLTVPARWRIEGLTEAGGSFKELGPASPAKGLMGERLSGNSNAATAG